MICQKCHKREATLHIKKRVKDEIKEQYLCEICAAEKNPYQSHKILNLNQLLSGMMELEGKSSGLTFQNEKKLQCPNCKMTYEEFKSFSRFGCAECYDTFKDKIHPLFRKIHGNVEHRGKLPKRKGGEISIHREIKALKIKMQQAIEKEAFEEAAKIRDEIKALEKEL